MQSVEKGYILNIVGECRGLVKDYVSIEDCWVQSIKGELSGDLPPYIPGY
jgi:hypothetical protein